MGKDLASATLRAFEAARALVDAGLSVDDVERLGARVSDETDGDADRAAANAWTMGARAMLNTILGRRICRICGCWEEEACTPACAWVASEGDLCTACFDPVNAERCFICLEAFKADDEVLSDVTEGLGHRRCFGESRDGYVNLETGEPLGPDEPIPTGARYGDLPQRSESDDRVIEPCSACGAITDPMLFCDEELEKTFCGDCWPATDCGFGRHDEGCSTAMFHGKATRPAGSQATEA